MPCSREQIDHLNKIKNQFINDGIDSLSDVDVIEILLSFAMKSKDVHEVAVTLIDIFGSFSAVLSAPYRLLIKQNGVSSHAAMLIKLLSDLPSIYNNDKYMAAYRKEHGLYIDLK